MSSAPLVPGPLYGLRTWRVVIEDGRERLSAPQRGTPWALGHGWVEAACGGDEGLRGEVLRIFDGMCKKATYKPTEDARKAVLAYVAAQPRVHGFGNARLVRNLFEQAVARHANPASRSTNLGWTPARNG